MPPGEAKNLAGVIVLIHYLANSRTYQDYIVRTLIGHNGAVSQRQ